MPIECSPFRLIGVIWVERHSYLFTVSALPYSGQTSVAPNMRRAEIPLCRQHLVVVVIEEG